MLLAVSTRAMRRTCTFSPTLAIRWVRASSTLSPEPSLAAFSASTSAAPLSSATLATSSVKARKLASLATKSVSELISTSTALPGAWAIAMRPSAATRLAFLSALARPGLRSQSAAAWMSPLFSVSAFLHSIMPAPVRSRSSLTIEAVMSAMGGLPRIRVDVEPTRGRLAMGLEPTMGRIYGRPGLLGGRRLVRGGGFRGGGFRGRGFRGWGFRGRCFRGRRFLGLGGGLLRRRLAGAARGLLAIAVVGELFLADAGGLRRGGLAFQHGVGGGAGVQLHGADRVVVARDRIVDQGRVVVGVDHGHDRDAKLLGFLDRDVLMADVDHEQRVGQAVHFLDAAQRRHLLVALAAQAQHFVLDQLLEGAI